jgi:tRNA(Ile)-lysidine synthase
VTSSVVRRAVRTALADVAPGRVLVAVSGGADSLALLAATLQEATAGGHLVGAVTVDHGLQAGSAARAAEVAATSRRLGADPVEALRVEVGRDGGPEAAARTARYAALDAAAERTGASAVLLGHTLDDQAETVLLGLARGSGGRSLSGMAAVSGRYVRPLLGVRRDQTRAACEEFGLTPWDDPHNADPAFTRVRVRTGLLPALTDALGPGAVEALARTADQLRADTAALDAWAITAEIEARTGGQAAAGSGSAGTDSAGTGSEEPSLDVAVLAALPAAVRTRVLRRAVLAAGSPAGSLTAAHLASVDALVVAWRGQGAVALPGPVSVRRDCGRLHLAEGAAVREHRAPGTSGR